MLDLKSKKILIHNLTFKGIEVVPGVLDFDQRGIVYADEGDVVVTKTKPDIDYLEYLQSLGWNFNNTLFISPKNSKTYSYNSVFYDQIIKSKLKNYKNYYLDTYNMTQEEEKFAQDIKIPFYGNSKISQKYGTKSGFRKLLKTLKIKIPDGVENIQDTQSSIKQIKKLFNLGHKQLAIKIDEGISGAGITKIDKDFLNLTSEEQFYIVNKALFKLSQANLNSGATIEIWQPEVIGSPSIQFEVFPDKTFKIVSTHDQILEGQEKWYIGCINPSSLLTPKIMANLKKDIEKFLNHLIKEGFIGFLGIDLVVTKDGTIYWIESNIRKPGTFYPRIIFEKLNRPNSVYLAADFSSTKLIGAKFKDLKKIFKNYLYSKKDGGIVLYNTGALKDAGRFDVVCISDSKSKVTKLYSDIKNFLKN